MADLITGRLDFSFASYNSARSNMDAKKLRAIAVDADQRLPALPDIQTLVELGLGEYRVGDWFGLVAPAGTPQPIVAALKSGIREGGAHAGSDQEADQQRQSRCKLDGSGDERADCQRSREYGRGDQRTRPADEVIGCCCNNNCRTTSSPAAFVTGASGRNGRCWPMDCTRSAGRSGP